jgi:hypothetical protein
MEKSHFQKMIRGDEILISCWLGSSFSDVVTGALDVAPATQSTSGKIKGLFFTLIYLFIYPHFVTFKITNSICHLSFLLSPGPENTFGKPAPTPGPENTFGKPAPTPG